MTGVKADSSYTTEACQGLLFLNECTVELPFMKPDSFGKRKKIKPKKMILLLLLIIIKLALACSN